MATKTGKGKSVKKTVVPKSKKSAATIKSFRSDTRQTESLIKAGRTSAAKAIRESKALELSITYMQKGILYKEDPDGKKTILKKSTKKSTGSSVILKRGMILYAKD